MPLPPVPGTFGNISIGNEFTVEQGVTVTEGFAEGTDNRLSLPGFNGPYPPEDLFWGAPEVLLWGSAPAKVLQW